MLKRLMRSTKPALAYSHVIGQKSPGVIFLPGFMSNMNGRKARALEEWCRANDHSFVRFDYRGTGSSEQPFHTFQDWVEDAADVMTNLTTGQQIVVGSSMGACIMLHLSKMFSERIVALIGLAPSFNFVENMRLRFQDLEQHSDETPIYKSPYGNYEIPVSFMANTNKLDLFREDENFRLSSPLRIVHGMKDDSVPWLNSLEFVQSQNCDSPCDVVLTLRKNGDHRLSSDEDITLIVDTLKSVIDDFHKRNLTERL